MALVLETNITPPITIPIDPRDIIEGEGGNLLGFIRPRLSGRVPIIGNVDYAPAGDPAPGLGSAVFFGVLILAVMGAWAIARRFR